MEEKSARESKVVTQQQLHYFENLLQKKQMEEDANLTPAQIQERIAALKNQ